MSTWTQEFITSADIPQVIPSSRIDGERTLAELACQSEVEYAWEYDDESQLWRYFPGTNFARTERINGKVTSYSRGLTIDPYLHYPNGRASTFYHIHPDAISAEIEEREFAVTFPVQAQIPSDEDIKACINLSFNGYREFRIVTALGVTSLGFDFTKTQVDNGNINLPGVQLSVEELSQIISSKGTDLAITHAFDVFNDHYAGALDFQYDSWQ